jgi:hypothetical protein
LNRFQEYKVSGVLGLIPMISNNIKWLRGLALVTLILGLAAGAAAQTSDGRLNTDSVMPGDSGTWVIETDSNASASVDFFKTGDADNTCTESESESDAEAGNCTEDGELDDYMIYNAWIDDGDRTQQENETSFNFTESSSLTDFTGDIVIKWELPRSTGNIVQSDTLSYGYNLTAHENSENDPDNISDSDNSDSDDNSGDGVADYNSPEIIIGDSRSSDDTDSTGPDNDTKEPEDSFTPDPVEPNRTEDNTTAPETDDRTPTAKFGAEPGLVIGIFFLLAVVSFAYRKRISKYLMSSKTLRN